MLNAIKNGNYFNISSGKSKKSMVLADDIAKYILIAANIGGIYNLTDTYHPSFYELSKCLAAKLNKRYVINIPYFIAKLIAIFGDSGFINIPLTTDKLEKICNTLTFDDTKARRNLNWSPRSVLKFGF
jgi:nucleoside-diphosphate-sugar epimerase